MKVRHLVAIGAAAAIATTGAVVVPGLAADAATKGKVSFLLVQGSASNNATVVMHGVINAGGKDVSKDNQDFDTVHLAGGTFRITHPDKDSTFSYKPNPKTCYASITGTGSYTIGHGTGKYKGVTGSGTFKLTGGGIAPRKKDGSCNFNSNGGSFASYATGSGPVSLP